MGSEPGPNIIPLQPPRGPGAVLGVQGYAIRPIAFSFHAAGRDPGDVQLASSRQEGRCASSGVGIERRVAKDWRNGENPGEEAEDAARGGASGCGPLSQQTFQGGLGS